MPVDPKAHLPRLALGIAGVAALASLAGRLPASPGGEGRAAATGEGESVPFPTFWFDDEDDYDDDDDDHDDHDQHLQFALPGRNAPAPGAERLQQPFRTRTRRS